MKEWYNLNNPESVISPSLLVYPDRIKKNIQIKRSGGDPDFYYQPELIASVCHGRCAVGKTLANVRLYTVTGDRTSDVLSPEQKNTNAQQYD